MAEVLIEIKRRPQTATTEERTQTRPQPRTSAAAAPTAPTVDTAKIAKQAAAMVAAQQPTPTEERKESYATAFSLIAFIGGIYLISQYKGK